MINLLSLLKTWALWARSLIRSRIFVLTIALTGFTFSASAQLITDYSAYLANLTNNLNNLIQITDSFSASLNTNLQSLGSQTTNANQKAIREIIECQSKIDDLKDVLQLLVNHVGEDSDGSTLMAFTKEIRDKVVLIEGYSKIISDFFDVDFSVDELKRLLDNIQEHCSHIENICEDIFYVLSEWYDEWSLFSANTSIYYNSVTGVLEEIIDAIGGGGGEGSSSIFDTKDLEDKIDDFAEAVTNVSWSTPPLYFTDWLEYTYDWDFWDDVLFENDEGRLVDYPNTSYSDNVGVAFNNITVLLNEINEGIARVVYLLAPTNQDFEEEMDNITNRVISAFSDGTNELNSIESQFQVDNIESGVKDDWNSVKTFLDGLFPQDLSLSELKFTVHDYPTYWNGPGSLEEITFDFSWLLPFIDMLRGCLIVFYVVLALFGEWLFVHYVVGFLWKLYEISNDFLSK